MIVVFDHRINGVAGQAVPAGKSREHAIFHPAQTVQDPQGAPVAGAEVTATNTETGVATVVKTSDIGIFYFSSLHPSRYKIVVKAAGPRVWKEHCVAG